MRHVQTFSVMRFYIQFVILTDVKTSLGGGELCVRRRDPFGEHLKGVSNTFNPRAANAKSVLMF